MSVESILKAFPVDAAILRDTGEYTTELYEALFEHFANSGEMPYGTMKARTGDPYEWIANRITAELEAL